ncbi:MAG: aldo/keto reductase [Christensenellales bacterium]
MRKIILGRTGLEISKTGFGALPVQRCTTEEAVKILRRALEGGITFFDTARAYSDSEKKIGIALSGERKKFVLATKNHSTDPEQMKRNLEASLRDLQTDYIDIYQFHNPPFVPKDGDPSYALMLRWKKEGIIRHIGLTNHSAARAIEAARSGLYDTLQYPLSCLSGGVDMDVISACREENVGLIAMKGMSGGLIRRAELSFVWMEQYDHIVPIWGVQYMHELEEFLTLSQNPPQMTQALAAEIEKEKEDLAGGFCRSCGYCMPCPAGIPIFNCARMMLLIGRSPWQQWVTPEWQANMKKIEDCLHCNTCMARCPYHLDTPALLAQNLREYKDFLKKMHIPSEVFDL